MGEIFHFDVQPVPQDLSAWVKEALDTRDSVRQSHLRFEIAGSEVIWDLCISPIKNDAGQITGAVLIFSDKTEQIRMETILKSKVPELSQSRGIAQPSHLSRKTSPSAHC